MKNWIKITLWSMFATGVLTSMYFVNNHILDQELKKPEIIVVVDGENNFITEEELWGRIKREKLVYEGQRYDQLNIERIEKFISEISQVRNARVYVKVGGEWRIEIELRKPIARIFNNYGETFYLDAAGVIMDISQIHTARTVVVNGAIPDRSTGPSVDEIINNDSLISIQKLDDIYRISSYVCDDPLFQALIGQMYLEKNGDFILIPLVGDQKINFGTAKSEEEVAEKFKKLKIFYDEAMPYEGWNTYSEISLKYGGQIVCKKK